MVRGGGTACQIGRCQPIKQPFPTCWLGRGEHAVSCLPLLPPNPAFHLPRTAAGVSTWLACLRGTPTAPPDHSCWSREWAIETTEARRTCKPLFDSQPISSQQWGLGAVRTCSLREPTCTCTAASAMPPEAVAVDTHTGANGSKNSGSDRHEGRDGRSLQKGNKEGTGCLRLQALLHPRFLCFWFLVFWQLRSHPRLVPGVSLSIYNFVQTPSLAVETITPCV